MSNIPQYLVALLTISLTGPAIVQAANIDVNINIGQPGYYGRIDIGDFGRPRLIYREPIVIYPVSVPREPIYLHVPPGHAKNWRKHCSKYNACGERVYFVQDSWYEREYVPRYQAMHHERHNAREDRRDDHHDDGHKEYKNKPGKEHKGHGKEGKGHGKKD